MKILAIEDEPITGMLLAASLRALDHAPTLLTDANWALAELDRGGFRLIVCDWRLSGMDGLELCRRIRARAGDYVYFILISSSGTSPENRDAALAAGVDDFLGKPLAADELRMRVRVAERILAFTARLRQLEARLPVCSYCKKVRTDTDQWTTVEQYFAQQMGARLSPSVCPECQQRSVVPGLPPADRVLPAERAGDASGAAPAAP